MPPGARQLGSCSEHTPCLIQQGRLNVRGNSEQCHRVFIPHVLSTVFGELYQLDAPESVVPIYCLTVACGLLLMHGRFPLLFWKAGPLVALSSRYHPISLISRRMLFPAIGYCPLTRGGVASSRFHTPAPGQPRKSQKYSCR